MTKITENVRRVAIAGDSSARVSAKQSATAADRDIVRRAARSSWSIEPASQMQRAWMPATRCPVVLLVQQLRDDGLEMYAEYLRHSGLAAITVSNAKDALTFAPVADIIVTGIVLDDTVDGVELVSRLRGDDGTRHKPIIVLTSCMYRGERKRAEHAGCDVFLSKPCLPDALLREVRLLLSTTHHAVSSPPQERRA